MAYAQQIEADMHTSPTGGQAARYDSNEPSGIPHAAPNHRAISCRLPEVHAVGKPLRRKLAWWISKIATNHFNYQPNHNSRVWESEKSCMGDRTEWRAQFSLFAIAFLSSALPGGHMEQLFSQP
jgi:hypothetical protein